jgi:hypothetical protein
MGIRLLILHPAWYLFMDLQDTQRGLGLAQVVLRLQSIHLDQLKVSARPSSGGSSNPNPALRETQMPR